MTTYDWSDEYAVGIDSIDDQHRRIFGLAAAMEKALLTADAAEMAGVVIQQLRDYIDDHLAHEEQMMAEVGFPGLEAHVDTHRRMSAKVAELLEEQGDGLVRVTEVHRFIATWLRRHILETDMQYVEFVRQKRAEEAGEEAGGVERHGLYQWSDRYSVGEPAIDGEHQRIFELAQAMHQALLDGDGTDAAEMIVFELSVYVEEHFAHEEESMREAGFPGLAAHRLIHRRMGLQVTEMLERLHRGEVRVSEVHRFVVTWLMRHILDEDMAYAPYLRRDVA